MRTPNDFDYTILEDTAHRPWPVPEGAWLMTQSWHDLLFAHWPLAPDLVAGRVPPALPLDLYAGRAWVSIIPFHMTNVAPRGVPALPWISAFPELNVRTYVTFDGKPGICFFSLDAGNPLAVMAARKLFHLPYHSAAMAVDEQDGWIAYSSRRTNAPQPANFIGRYRAAGPVRKPAAGTLEYFLTERYCLYTIDRRACICRLEIHHRPWPLQPAELETSANTIADASGLSLPPVAPVLHYAKRQDVVAWRLRRIGFDGPAPYSSAMYG